MQKMAETTMAKVNSSANKHVQATLTKDQKIHNYLSDILMITNESQATTGVAPDKKKTFLYEYIGGSFRLDDLDLLLMNRLQKNRDENKFVYLMQCYRRVEGHLYSKVSSGP